MNNFKNINNSNDMLNNGFSAYNPDSCVFVSANAGSGKTSLLAGRVLSLLLNGIEPEKILCLTFTNAAAAEMESRILKELGAWVMVDDAALVKSVSKLTNGNVSEILLARARGLFARVLESAQGINIQTIHGFSQSLLRRFPLEAGISPYFTVMDARSEQEVMKEARLRLFTYAQKSDSHLQAALNNLSQNISEFSFNKLIDEIIGNKRKFRSLLQTIGGLPEIERALYLKFNIVVGETVDSLLARSFIYSSDDRMYLKQCADGLFKSKKDVDLKTATLLADWLTYPDSRKKYIADYIAGFITKDGEKRKKIFTKEALQQECLIDALMDEQERVYQFCDKFRALNIVRHSVDVLSLAEALLAEYEAIKRSHGWMDYDDLIMTSCALLTRAGMSQWVLFKLDGGIDHILVDEAQDTSPEQWQIIDALTQEFFAGQSAKETSRSLFIVGDEKQSIYSFQGADVKELNRMRNYFAELINSAGRIFDSLELTNSYRSTEDVLRVVDAVFAKPEARSGVITGTGELKHIVTKIGRAGLVELFPLIRVSEEEEISVSAKLVRHIADTIQGWIKNGEARAGDIMILLRSRTTLADRLVRALKRRGVPVSGSDRMELNDNLAVQDLIALGQVLLLPDDDLTLASCLKSPIFNLDDDDLFVLAYQRGEKTLWQRLGEEKKYAQCYELISELRAMADYLPPFELYSWLLNHEAARSKFIGRMGEECADPIDEFMQQALLYERSHPPSLQGFLHWLVTSNSIIKRDMEQVRGAVRIMTIHGAKGLQAKIVILADTVEVPHEKDSLFWLDGVVVRGIDADKDDKVLKQVRIARQQEISAEYRRLLYVALTRAEDRLYIFGATGKDKINEKSWYQLVKNGMEDIAEIFTTEFGEGLRVGQHITMTKIDIQPEEKPDSSFRENDHEFCFLQQSAPIEPSPSKPLTPSKTSEHMNAASSPVTEKKIYALGKFIHSLLQYLPSQHSDKRVESANLMARKYMAQLSEETIKQAINDAINIIQKADFAFLFGGGSLAEVPITGIIHGVTVSGQIDRLYISETEVWIVDFKSNQLPPAEIDDISVSYLRQLALYRLLMQEIYPDKQVICGLLWTVTAKLDVLPEAMLDEVVLNT